MEKGLRVGRDEGGVGMLRNSRSQILQEAYRRTAIEIARRSADEAAMVVPVSPRSYAYIWA
jgi:hypothetical protein